VHKTRPFWRYFPSAILMAAAFVAGLCSTPAKHRQSTQDTSGLVPISPHSADGFAGGLRESKKEDFLTAVESKGTRLDSEAGYANLLKSLMQWVAADPQAAREYVRTHYDPRHRNAFLSDMLAAWAGKDPQAALDWVMKNSPHDYTQYDAVLTKIGEKDPDMAWRCAGQLLANEAGLNGQSIFVSALRGIAYTGNYQKAAALIANLQMPGGQQKYDLTGFLAGEWGLYDPAAAAQWVASLPDDGGMDRQQALVSLGVSWAQSDPEAAADFAVQLPPGVTRQNMLATALGSWATNNPEQAAAWLNQYQADPDLDMVVRSLASSPNMIDADPNAAVGWASTITDNAIRLQTLNLIMNRWMSEDASSAESYLQTATNLPAATLAKLRSNFNVSQ